MKTTLKDYQNIAAQYTNADVVFKDKIPNKAIGLYNPKFNEIWLSKDTVQNDSERALFQLFHEIFHSLTMPLMLQCLETFKLQLQKIAEQQKEIKKQIQVASSYNEDMEGRANKWASEMFKEFFEEKQKGIKIK